MAKGSCNCARSPPRSHVARGRSCIPKSACNLSGGTADCCRTLRTVSRDWSVNQSSRTEMVLTNTRLLNLRGERYNSITNGPHDMPQLSCCFVFCYPLLLSWRLTDTGPACRVRSSDWIFSCCYNKIGPTDVDYTFRLPDHIRRSIAVFVLSDQFKLKDQNHETGSTLWK